MTPCREITYLINADTGCWECNSHKPDSYGYPRFRVNIKIFRFMYETHKGPIPKGLLVRHTCDNRKCINPDHLLLGTAADNAHDAIERGRYGKGFFAPCKLTKEDVLAIRSSKLMNIELAKIYNVSNSMISGIRTRQKWKHI